MHGEQLDPSIATLGFASRNARPTSSRREDLNRYLRPVSRGACAAELRVVGGARSLPLFTVLIAPRYSSSSKTAGLSAAVRLARHIDARLVGSSGFVSQELLFHAVEAGIAGFLTPRGPDPEGRSLRNVQLPLVQAPSCRACSRVCSTTSRASGSWASRGQRASRESEVLGLLACRGSTNEIARAR
jgi:hypothetical protein